MSNHTPGPWTVEYDDDVVDVDFGPIVKWPYRIIDRNGKEVVDFTGGCDVSEDDARLIAAAPEMYAMLFDRVVVRLIDVHGDRDSLVDDLLALHDKIGGKS